MKRSLNLGLLAAALIALLVEASAAWFVLWPGSVLHRHNSLQQLQEMPAGAHVHLLVRVTYIDPPGKRFWVQDETGAAPIPLDPAAAHVRVGEVVSVDAVRTARYDPLLGPASLGLDRISVQPSSADVKLPPPGIADLGNFPTPEKKASE